jgi:hypothetical protein
MGGGQTVAAPRTHFGGLGSIGALIVPAGHREERSPAMTASAQDWINRLEVMDVGLRYAAAIDTRDWAALGACFAAEGVWRTPAAAIVGPEAIARFCRKSAERWDATHHVATNAQVTLVEGGATMRSNFTANHVVRGLEGGENALIGGYYLDRLERGGDGVWRFAERALTIVWHLGNAAILGNPG